MAERIRRVSVWRQDGTSEAVELSELGGREGFRWFELACGAEEAGAVLAELREQCPGLEEEMLEDLLTPDDQPEGKPYKNGIRLASSFSVSTWSPESHVERGKPQGIGFFRFQPVELLAGDGWLVTCWHPQRTFQGSKRQEDDVPPGDADKLFEAVAARWKRKPGQQAGDLGISVMRELALTYTAAHRKLHVWLEDWELSLYTEEKFDSHDQLPELWGLMAVFRDWLNPLNKADLRGDLDKAWLPTSDHQAVIKVDERIDKALAALGKLSDTMRQSFNLLHLEQTEEQRRQSESTQHRFERIAVGFLVPTFIVGLYGANTWVPGQGRHWGFWVMVLALVLLSLVVVALVRNIQKQAEVAEKKAREDRKRIREELLRTSSSGSFG